MDKSDCCGRKPKVELYEKNLEAVERGGSKTTRRLHVAWYSMFRAGASSLLYTTGDVPLENGALQRGYALDRYGPATNFGTVSSFR